MQVLFKWIIICFLSMETFQVLNAAGNQCTTRKGKPCQFPFEIGGKVSFKLEKIFELIQ